MLRYVYVKVNKGLAKL